MGKTIALLEEINEGIKYQNKLLESLLDLADTKRHQADEGRKTIEGVIEKLANNPLIKGNHQAEDLIKNLFKF